MRRKVAAYVPANEILTLSSGSRDKNGCAEYVPLMSYDRNDLIEMYNVEGL